MRKQLRLMAYNRPEEVALCVDHILRCQKLDSWDIVASVDAHPNGTHDDRVVDQLRRLPGVVVTRERLGMNRHAWLTLSEAAAQADLVFHVEEDVLLAPDALQWAENRWNQFRREFACYCCFGPKISEGSDIIAMMPCHRTESLFVAWGTLLSSEVLRDIFSTWQQPSVCEWRPQVCWDTTLSQIFASKNWQTLTPIITRSRNIGAADVRWAQVIERPVWSGDVV